MADIYCKISLLWSAKYFQECVDSGIENVSINAYNTVSPGEFIVLQCPLKHDDA